MADLGNLEIQITASTTQATKAIDNLISGLSRLNSALNNYRGNSQYSQGMNALASGLERVASSINSIDDKKIRNLSSALNSLSNAGKNISFKQTSQEVDDLTRKAEKVNQIGSSMNGH